MLVLQKLDLFDVKYGLLVSNIEKVFNEENEKYLLQSNELYKTYVEQTDEELETIKLHIRDLAKSITTLDVYGEEVTPYLEEVSRIFGMDIDFAQEWADFLDVQSREKLEKSIQIASSDKSTNQDIQQDAQNEQLDEMVNLYYNNYFFTKEIIG